MLLLMYKSKRYKIKKKKDQIQFSLHKKYLNLKTIEDNRQKCEHINKTYDDYDKNKNNENDKDRHHQFKSIFNNSIQINL